MAEPVRNIFSRQRETEGRWSVWNGREGQMIGLHASEAEAKAQQDKANAAWRAYVRGWKPGDPPFAYPPPG